MYKVKVLVVGPCKSGKTVISNFLSDATETSGNDYHPTQGARILEFEAPNLRIPSGRSVTAEVELWDVSGDQKFESCWPAMARDSNGIIFVFNPEEANHDKQLETWYSYFTDQSLCRDDQCTIFAHHKATPFERRDPDIPQSMNKLSVVHTNIDDDGDALRDDFSRFMEQLLTSMSDKREQEELSIMNSR